MTLWETVKKRSAPWLLALVFLVAAGRVLLLQGQRAAPDKTIIRIAHYQMESGVRDAVDAVARRYQELHPDVQIEQIVIGERGYVSWATTRLLGGTAPDIMMVPDERLYQRYFLPLTEEIEKPNPYNRGTPLEGMAWKDTYYDNMAGGYVETLKEFYDVSSSAHTLRLFYNEALFKKATGLDKPPADFRGFIAACEKIKKYDDGRIVPIAGAGKYNAKPLWERFEIGVGSTLAVETDTNSNGLVSNAESATAFVSGAVDFHDPRLAAMFAGREAYNRQFQPGFFAADRMDAAFLFLQQRATMIASGSWDAGSYKQQADFPIGICDFPLPSKDDPEFGKFVEGPAVEDLTGRFRFAINRYSPHPDVALDFLKFFSSQEMNALFNNMALWIPIIRGNRPDPSVAAFWPNLNGVRPGINLAAGALNLQKFEELINLHAAGQLSFDDFVTRYAETYLANAETDLLVDQARKDRLTLLQNEFTKTAEREIVPPGSPAPRSLLILDSQIGQRYDTLENESRFRRARDHSPLPHRTP